MAFVHSFPPVVAPGARVLVQGRTPGEDSLRAQRCDAHPQNTFWPIVGAVLGFDPALDYAARLAVPTTRAAASRSTTVANLRLGQTRRCHRAGSSRQPGISAAPCGLSVRRAAPNGNPRAAAAGSAGDVLRHCERDGSLDAAIRTGSMRTDDFAGLFAAHRGIRAVLCNGGTAHRLFTRIALPQCSAAPTVCVRLPSTIQAHAGMTRAVKLAVWRTALEPHLTPP